MRSAAQAAGVEIATIAGYTDFTAGRNTPEVPYVELQLAYINRLAGMAQKLGAGLVRVFSGYAPDTAHYQADWDKSSRPSLRRRR